MEGAKAIAEALTTNIGLTKLEIGFDGMDIISVDDNSISDEGIVSIAKALRINATLQTLSMCKPLIISTHYR